MKNLFGIIAILILVVTVSAQTDSKKAEQEVLNLRTKIREAVSKKDETALKIYFADGFTHTHASGKVDDKAERIAFFLKREPTIEDVEPDEIRIYFFNKGLASAVAKTTLKFGEENRTFQWTGVYFKDKGKWKVLITHVTALRN